MTTNKISWSELESLCNASAVDEALRNFAADNTGDNATCVVRAVLDAAAGFRGAMGLNTEQPVHQAVPVDVAAAQAPAEFCCEAAWQAARDRAWKSRNLRCGCDHVESCLKCYPAEFRRGGRFYEFQRAEKVANGKDTA